MSTRLCSSGIARSRLRSPASTCTSGISRALAASAPPSVVFVSPCTTTAARWAVREVLVERADDRAELRAPTAPAHGELNIRLAEMQGFEELARHVVGVVLPGMDETRVRPEQTHDPGELDDLGPRAEDHGDSPIRPALVAHCVRYPRSNTPARSMFAAVSVGICSTPETRVIDGTSCHDRG